MLDFQKDHPQIGKRTLKVEFLRPSMFTVRERAHQTNLEMWKGRIRLMRGSQGAIGALAGLARISNKRRVS